MGKPPDAQEVCPYNVKFAQELKEPASAARETIAGKDARTLARERLSMSQEQFSAAFKNSPMKRAKLRGVKRNATVVLGNVGSEDDVPVLVAALPDTEPLVRAHAGRRWAGSALLLPQPPSAPPWTWRRMQQCAPNSYQRNAFIVP